MWRLSIADVLALHNIKNVVRRYTEIEELTQTIVHEFIDRIIVHEPEQARGDRRQKVGIIYNNIGAVDRIALKGLG